MTRPPKKVPSQLIISHGLYVDLQRYKIDGTSALGHALRKSRNALAELFPDGKPDAAANVLINMIVYKTLKIELFQSWDYATGEAKPLAVQHYIQLSNSLRRDLTTLLAMVDREKPPQVAPDLQEYLKAAKATVIKGERG